MHTVEIKKLAGSLIEITGQIPAGDFEVYRKKAIEELGREIKIDGFRPGMVPEKVLEEKLGASSILEKAAEKAIQDVYPKILRENKIAAIGRPEIVITKIAKGNPLEFRIKTAVIPEFELPDYKEIAEEINKEKGEVEVDEKEIEQTIEYILQSRKEKTEEGEERVPAFTDDFVKTLGEFKDVDDFKEKIRENIKKEKEVKERERRRLKILEKIIEKLEIELPRVLVEAEKDKILMETKANIEQMGLKWEDYLNQIKKKEEELLAGWEEDAVKRVKLALVLDKLAEAEKIEVPEDEAREEAEKLIRYYKERGAEVDESRAKMYIYGILRNEKIFQRLESF